MTESRVIELADRKVQLTVGGNGPPLLYLHSAGGETEWCRIHERLAEQFTVYVPAHPGFALSTGLEHIRDIYDLAWHYVDLIEHQGWEGFPVLGFSLGGWIALETAILRPHLFPQMTLVNSAGVRVEGVPMGELFTDDLTDLRDLLFYDPNSDLVEEAMPSSFDDPRMLLWLRAREASARVGWNPYFHNPRLPDHLHRITCPTQIIWGEQDRLFPPAHAHFLAERIPNAEVQIVPETGHMLPYEATDYLVNAVCHTKGKAPL